MSKKHKYNKINNYNNDLTTEEYREQYNNNKFTLDGLYRNLENTKKGIDTGYSLDELTSYIEDIEKQQDFLAKKLKKSIYKRFRKKSLLKEQIREQKVLQSKSIEKEPVKTTKDDEMKVPAVIMPKKKIEHIIDKKEIIVGTYFVNNYISDVVEKPKKEEKKEIVEVKPKEIVPKVKREFPDARIVFDGVYKVKNCGETIYQEPIDDVLLEHNNINKTSVKNANIIKVLNHFDEINNSNLCERYKNGNLEVVYDLISFDRLQEDVDITKRIEAIAKKEAKHNDKIIVRKKNKFGKLKVGVSAIAAAALLVAGGMGIMSKLHKNKKSDKATKTNVEYASDNNLESLNTVQNTKVVEPTTEATTEMTTEATTELTTEATTEVTTEATTEVTTEATTEEVTEAITESTTEEISIEVNNDIKIVEPDEEEVTEPVVIENEVKEIEDNQSDIRIGDVVMFNDAPLYYSSVDPSPAGNSSYLDNPDCRVNMIAIVYQGTPVEVITDENASVKEIQNMCEEKYGDDIQVFINSDVIDENENTTISNLGWVDVTDDNAKSKVLK